MASCGPVTVKEQPGEAPPGTPDRGEIPDEALLAGAAIGAVGVSAVAADAFTPGGFL